MNDGRIVPIEIVMGRDNSGCLATYTEDLSDRDVAAVKAAIDALWASKQRERALQVRQMHIYDLSTDWVDSAWLYEQVQWDTRRNSVGMYGWSFGA